MTRRRGVALTGALTALGALLCACGGSAPGTAATAHRTTPVPLSSSPSAQGSTPSTSSAPAMARHVDVRVLPYRLPQPLAREAVIPGAQPTVTVAGGLLAGDASSASAYTLDLGSGAVHRLRSLPVPVHDTAGTLAGGTELVVGGGNAAEQAVVQARSGGGWHVIGRLPQARSDLSVVSVGGRSLAIGGYDGTRPAEPDILTTTDGRSWSVTGRLPVPVRYAATAVADGAVWVFGGEVARAMQTVVQRIDAATGHASVAAHLPQRLGHATACVLGGRVLLLGGRTGQSTLTDRMWWFDPASGRLRSAGRLPTALADSAAAEVGDTCYLVGGETPSPTDRVLAVTAR